MDEILFHIYQANVYSESYIEMNICDFMFENDDETNKEIINNNDGIIAKTFAHIKKAVSLIIEQLKKLSDKLKDFINKALMSGKQKALLRDAKNKIKSNPELSAMKVDCPTFKEYEVIYDDTLKMIDKEMSKENSSDKNYNVIIDGMNKKLDKLKNAGKSVTNYAKNTPKRAGNLIVLNTLVDVADKNCVCAKAINDSINKEVNILNSMTDSLGEKEVSKFKKKVDKYSKNTVGHRFKLAVLRRKEQTLEDVIKLQTRKILSYTNINRKKVDSDGNRKSIITPDSLIKGAIENPGFTKKVLFSSKKRKK